MVENSNCRALILNGGWEDVGCRMAQIKGPKEASGAREEGQEDQAGRQMRQDADPDQSPTTGVAGLQVERMGRRGLLN